MKLPPESRPTVARRPPPRASEGWDNSCRAANPPRPSRRSHRIGTFLIACGCAAFALAGRAANAAEAPRSIADLRFTNPADASAWTSWSPRAEISPQFSFDPQGGREGRGALRITARAASEFGAWRRVIDGVAPGKSYRFNAWFRGANLANERRSVIARLEWLDARGQPVRVAVRPPEYPLDAARDGGWVKLEAVLRAPEGARALDVQLALGFAADASVWWDTVSLAEVAPADERAVRVMTVHLRPKNSPSREASVEQFCAAIEQAAAQKPDIVCLPEGMTVIGTKQSYVEVSEPVPGPTTERLGALARRLNCYLVAGLYERVAPVVYNTAVLVDREGKLAGRYRKTHLPREEWEAGLTPGDTYPTFVTDFGRIGLMVCWDLQFPEPWRALGQQGAELVLLPIWGGSETLLRARAIENHAFVVSSSYDMKSCVVAPDGEILAEATKTSPVAIAEIHLNRKIYQPWLGDMSTRTWKERRGELPAR